MAMGGLDPTGHALLDADGQLSMRFDPFSLGIGFRQLVIWSSSEPPFLLNGPVLSLTGRF